MADRQMTRVQLIERSPRRADGSPELNQSLVGRWLEGTHRPTFDKAVATGRALGVPIREAVWEAGFRPAPGDPVVLNGNGAVEHLLVRVTDDDELEAVKDFLDIWRRRSGN
jgi:hypothetical protein